MRPWIPLFLPGLALGFTLKQTGDGIPLHWPDGRVRLAVEEPGSGDVPGHAEFGAVRAALATWNAIPDSPVPVQPAEGDSAAARVTWRTDWQDQPDALAVTVLTYDVDTGDILDAEIRVNDEVNWAIADGRGGDDEHFDVENTVAHEIGHLFGLAHSDDPTATMYATSAPWEIEKRDLAEDDLAGFEQLYGVAAPEDAAAASRASGCSMAPASGQQGAAFALLLLLLLALLAARRPMLLCVLLISLEAQAAPPEETPVGVLLARAERIVVARVRESRSTWVGDTIQTDTEVEIRECLRGPCPARLVVRQPGGEIGRIGQSVEGRVDLRSGTEVLLFLLDRIDGTVHPVGMARGVMRIEGDRGMRLDQAPELARSTALSLLDLRQACAGSEQRGKQSGDGRAHGPRPDQRRRQSR